MQFRKIGQNKHAIIWPLVTLLVTLILVSSPSSLVYGLSGYQSSSGPEGGDDDDFVQWLRIWKKNFGDDVVTYFADRGDYILLDTYFSEYFYYYGAPRFVLTPREFREILVWEKESPFRYKEFHVLRWLSELEPAVAKDVVLKFRKSLEQKKIDLNSYVLDRAELMMTGIIMLTKMQMLISERPPLNQIGKGNVNNLKMAIDSLIPDMNDELSVILKAIDSPHDREALLTSYRAARIELLEDHHTIMTAKKRVSMVIKNEKDCSRLLDF